MCGIVGYFDKTTANQTAVGERLLKMLDALACRGPDSAEWRCSFSSSAHLVAQVKLGDGDNLAERAQLVTGWRRSSAANSFHGRCVSALLFKEVDNLKPFLSKIESVGNDVEVVSVGRRLEIVKEVGSPARLEKAFHVSQFQGKYGIGHTRLSTEFGCRPQSFQPFWGHGYADLAIVHNGHITNYHQLRRIYEQRGVRFYTENDSEIWPHF